MRPRLRRALSKCHIAPESEPLLPLKVPRLDCWLTSPPRLSETLPRISPSTCLAGPAPHQSEKRSGCERVSLGLFLPENAAHPRGSLDSNPR